MSALVVFVLCAAPARAADLALLTEENPPFTQTDPATGKVTGQGAALVFALLERAGISHTVEVVPWARGYRRTLAERNTCLFLTDRTAERETLFEWVGPLVDGGLALFAREDWPHEARSIEDIKPYLIAVPADSAVERYLRERGVVNLLPMARQNFQVLAAGRVDLLASGLTNGPEKARQAGVRVKVALPLTRANLSLACHPDTDGRLLERMREALRALVREGVIPPTDPTG